mgnify:CR=1 FL=1
MRVVFGLILVLGIGLAGGAVYLTMGLFQDYERRIAYERSKSVPAIETIEVYVAKEGMRYGQRITKDDVLTVSYPMDSLPEGVFTTEEDLFPAGEKELRTVLRAIEPMEALMTAKVTSPGEDAGLTARLGEGMRAFAIEVDVASGVSGFLRPGDRVDVYWTGQVNLQTGAQRNGSEVTQLIQTAVEIIAVDQVANSETTGTIIARTVTVAANPQNVAALAQAQSTGRLSLSLVGVGDETVAEAIQVDQRSLLGITEYEPEPEIVEKAICTIRTRRGGEVIVTPIPCADNS